MHDWIRPIKRRQPNARPNGVGMGYKHWCPKGCGKSLIFYKQGYYFGSKTKESFFVCNRCDTVAIKKKKGEYVEWEEK